MQLSETITSIAPALALAAGAFPAIPKNKEVVVQTRTGGSYTFRYATLDAIVNAVRPPLSANGLVIVQSVVSEEITYSGANGVTIEREDMLETRLLHSSGEWLSNLTPVLIDPDEKSAQAYGSAITYARRYGITQLLCVVADEDEDGNAAAGNVARSTSSGSNRGGGAVVSEKQANMLRAKLRAIGGLETGLCAFLQVESIDSVPKGKMDSALAAIEAKDPAIMHVSNDSAEASSQSKSDQDAARKADHDKVVDVLEESLLFIRYHLSEVLPDDVNEELGEPDPLAAAREWQSFEADQQRALWLAPSKGGWFTTIERDQVRASVAKLSASTKA